MRIGIDIRRPAAPAGQQRYLWRLANWLADRGEEVEVISTHGSGNGIEPHSNRRVHALRGSSHEEVRARVRQLELDVLFANPERAIVYEGLPIHVLRPGYGTRQGIQNLRSVRTAPVQAIYRLGRAAPWRRARLRHERDCYGQTDPLPQVIAISQMMAGYIQRDYGVSSQRLHLVYNGVDLDEFSPAVRLRERARARSRLGIESDAFCPVFVGHNFRRKGLYEVFDALAGFQPAGRPLAVLVAGSGTGGAQRRHAKKRARKLGLANAVHFAGDVVPISLAYAAADVLLFPSWHDAFGFVVLEAMACGLPVITTRWAGAHELVRPGVDGFVLDAPDDGAQLLHALRLLRDRERRDDMGASARERAEAFSEGANFEAVYGVVKLAAEARGAGGA